jgi:hypothetical protein
MIFYLVIFYSRRGKVARSWGLPHERLPRRGAEKELEFYELYKELEKYFFSVFKDKFN